MASRQFPKFGSPITATARIKILSFTADYSDPDVIRVGDDYYLAASSFNSAPGLPILHSKDLVNWRIISYALPRQPPVEVYSKPQHGNGVWAPSIRYHEGAFYIYYPDPDYGIYLVKAKNPAGPWSEPLLVKAAKGWIDPCPLWTADGNSYLVSAMAASRSGVKSILVVSRMSADGTKLLDDGVLIFDGHDKHPTVEGLSSTSEMVTTTSLRQPAELRRDGS